MALSSTAEAVAQEIVTALKGLPKGEDQSAEAWELVLTKISTWITTNAVVTIPAGSINTAGSAAAQVGPPSPVPIVGGVS